ncbi:MAG: hypothetical protein AB7O96_00900 [Pseudobdellovibrionaceae bacterium]
MGKYFKITNWESFQHYNDRNPPWIKLYNSLLDKYEFGQLSDSAKGHLVCIWLLASRSNNKVPWDEKWVTQRIQASSRVNLQELENLGFINSYSDKEPLEQDASMLVALARSRETEREGEKEKSIPPLPPKGVGEGFEKFWNAYPKRKSKGQAEKAWSKLKPNEQLTDKILQAVERAKTSESWQKDGGQFIPYPASWLNAKGWEDNDVVNLTSPRSPPPKAAILELHEKIESGEVSSGEFLSREEMAKKAAELVKNLSGGKSYENSTRAPN